MNSEGNLEIINKYIEAYNSIDIEGMIDLLHQEVVFRNFSNHELTTETVGIQSFRDLAEESAKIFSSRRQTVTDIKIEDDKTVVQIDYEAVLAVDLPNGLKAGDRLQLKGKSVFGIVEGKISLIEDYS